MPGAAVVIDGDGEKGRFPSENVDVDVEVDVNETEGKLALEEDLALLILCP